MIKKFAIFCIVGILAAGIDLLIFNAAFSLKSPFVISRVLAVLSAIIFNFSLNRNITFKAKNGCIKNQFPKHIAIYTLVMITNVIVSSLAFQILGQGTINANISSVIGIASGIPISFFGSMLWTFKGN